MASFPSTVPCAHTALKPPREREAMAFPRLRLPKMALGGEGAALERGPCLPLPRRLHCTHTALRPTLGPLAPCSGGRGSLRSSLHTQNQGNGCHMAGGLTSPLQSSASPPPPPHLHLHHQRHPFPSQCHLILLITILLLLTNAIIITIVTIITSSSSSVSSMSPTSSKSMPFSSSSPSSSPSMSSSSPSSL